MKIFSTLKNTLIVLLSAGAVCIAAHLTHDPLTPVVGCTGDGARRCRTEYTVNSAGKIHGHFKAYNDITNRLMFETWNVKDVVVQRKTYWASGRLRSEDFEDANYQWVTKNYPDE